jgi:hypothetical protein
VREREAAPYDEVDEKKAADRIEPNGAHALAIDLGIVLHNYSDRVLHMRSEAR